MEVSEPTDIAYSNIKIEARRNALFETPVVLAKLHDSEGLLKDLEKVVRCRWKEDPSGLLRSNEGGWHSDTDMINWGGESARWLSNHVVALAKQLSKFVDTTADGYHWHSQMWANISPGGAYNQLHVHPGNLWSAVLYLNMGGDDPLGNDVSDSGGSIYFEDPRMLINSMHNPCFRFDDSKGNAQLLHPEVRTMRGDLLMFPSWLRHGVKPYKGNKERISIAINVDATKI